MSRTLVVRSVVAVTFALAMAWLLAPLARGQSLPHEDILRFGQGAIPATAHELFPVNSKDDLRMLHYAEGYWHNDLCSGDIRVSRHPLYPLQVIAEATWYTGSNPNRYLRCEIEVNSRRQALSFINYCAVMVHEVGHLSGFHERGGLDGGIHSRSKYSVMYPTLLKTTVPVYCKVLDKERNARLNAPSPATLRIGFTGPRVKALQWMLGGHRPSAYRPIATYHKTPNGLYGKYTADAVRAMKYRLGWPKKELTNQAGRDFLDILQGKRRRPKLYIARAAARLVLLKQVQQQARATACARTVVRIATRELGVTEVPYGSNRGPRVDQYQRVVGLRGVPWCAAFDQWVFASSGYGTFAGRSAYVPYIRQWAYSHALLHAVPKVGSLAIFYYDSHHMGIVVQVTRSGFYSIDGNWSNGVRRVFHSPGSTPTAFVWLPGCHAPLRAGFRAFLAQAFTARIQGPS